MQVVHEVIQKLRAGQYVDRVFQQIVLVGFSIGGIVANGIADKYPEDVSAFVLIGISWDLTWIYPAFLAGLQSSASTIDPERWGHLNPLYQTQPTLATREVACFFGEYDHDALVADFATRDFDTLGAAITFTYHLVEAPEFAGPVFLGIGKSKCTLHPLAARLTHLSDDGTFCGGEVCGSQPYALYEKFPAASDHEIRVYEKTGHAILYHHAGSQMMEDVKEFLAGHKP